MQLTKTLLEADFDLQVDLPEDRLCPPVNIVYFDFVSLSNSARSRTVTITFSG
jgi:23S rRNA A1618 N6-methylase RlmF